MGSRERGGENTGCHQSAKRRHFADSEQRVVGGGADHGVSEPQELCPNPGDLHDREDDDHHPADAVRLPSRLYPQRTSQHQLSSTAELVYADCTGL